MLAQLYKKTSTGKIQSWKISTVQKDDGVLIVSERGQVGGKINSDGGKLITKGKNIGKANETTPQEQALLEAESKWKKKKDEGYFETIEEAQTELVLLPMLAHSFEKRGHGINWPAIGQPKLDGTRSLGTHNTLITRKGKKYPHLEHIKDAISNTNSNIVLDGELYSHELEFETITGLVRRETLKDGDDEEMKKIILNVYDCILLDEPNATFEERYEALSNVVKEIDSPYVTLVENVVLQNEEEMREQHNKMLEDGYEGIMVRNVAGKYGINKRSADLIKFKMMQREEYEITDFFDGEGLEKGCIIYTCKNENGDTFNVRPRGTHEERKVLFEEGNCIGEFLSVQFQELSRDGIPRFPVGLGVRWKEDM